MGKKTAGKFQNTNKKDGRRQNRVNYYGKEHYGTLKCGFSKEMKNTKTPFGDVVIINIDYIIM